MKIKNYLIPFCIILLLIILPIKVLAEDNLIDPIMYGDKQFVILKSTTSYQEALEFAKKAAKELGLKLDLRDLFQNKDIGLSYSKSELEEGGFPFYVPRGRWDDGSYVSIEYSSAFKGFRKGLYMVVGTSGGVKSKPVMEALKQARKYYPDAYAKVAPVYFGCMH